ncbi:hypothetical protein GLOTRDRAFT_37434, partial [Gloeophyllum trabeum ATCC 11539]
QYPLLYRVALDILPVQASAVPCERVFSSSGETDDSRRSKLSAFMFEVLQILKYLYRHERLDFAADWAAKEADLREVLEPPKEKVHGLISSDQIDVLAQFLEKYFPDDRNDA